MAIDGTKIQANASKHKAMSYERMDKDDARLTTEIEALLTRADEVDAAEDAQYGVGQEPQDLPAELQRREARRAKIREVRAALKQEAAEARAAQLRAQGEELRAKAADPMTSPKKQGEFATLAKKRDAQADKLDDDDRDPPAPDVDGDLPRNHPPTTTSGEPTPKAQRNFTDPESRIMVRDGAFMQGYNAQIAVDEGHQIIVAAALSNQSPDNEYFAPMLRRVVNNCDAVPTRVTGDSGYFSAANVRAAEHMGAEPFISVGKHRNDGTQEATTASPQARSPARLAMRARLEAPDGRAAYARRKATVEPVFGQIRACRGFQHMSFRGLFKSRCEWLFVCLTHNLLKLFRATRATRATLAGAHTPG
ncbi:MAG: transposase [Deltaproteobacteria bacterium]|nr:transposase [Deltaproteobacteria bacterium]